MRWIVYRENTELGPYSTEQVRAGLRSGELDPFDMVARVDSKIRQLIVEVDDIFVPKDEPTRAKGLPAAERGTRRTRVSKRRLEMAPSPDLPPNPEPGARNMRRKYFLLSPGFEPYGPLSAREIRGFLARGLIAPKTKVQKIGANKKIPIEAFVKAYNRGDPSVPLPINRGQLRHSPFEKLTDTFHTGIRFGKARMEWSILPWLIGAAIILVGIYLFTNKDEIRGHFKTVPDKVTRLELRATDIPKFTEKSPITGETPLEKAPKEPTIIPQEPVLPVTKTPVIREVTTRHREGGTTRIFDRARGNPRSQVRQKHNLQMILAANVNQAVKLRDLRFDPNDMKTCDVKCRVRFWDGKGGSFFAVFYKSAYGDRLLRLRGRKVELRGRIIRNGPFHDMLVQGIN